MQDFRLHRPSNLSEATSLQSDDAKFLAGGQSLLPLMKLGLAAPSDLVVLAGLEELRGIRTEGGTLVVGAAMTHAEVAESSAVAEAIPALAQLAGGIGDAQVRNRGTLGGSLAHADPVADYPAAILALDACIVTNRREIAAEDFFRGLFETALEEQEIICEVRFPRPDEAGWAKFPNPASKFALVAVMVARTSGSVRLAVTGAAPSVFRVAEMEAALAKRFSPEALENIAVPSDDLLDEIDASADYRAHLVSVMARRAVANCK